MRLVRSPRAQRLSRPRRRRERARPRAAPSRPRADPFLPAYTLGPDWPAVPIFADLLGLCRRGDPAARPLGGFLDGSGASLPLPPVGRLGLRSAAPSAPRRRLLGAPMALWALASACVSERGGRALPLAPSAFMDWRCS